MSKRRLMADTLLATSVAARKAIRAIHETASFSYGNDDGNGPPKLQINIK
jgi:hypothetical protein